MVIFFFLGWKKIVIDFADQSSNHTHIHDQKGRAYACYNWNC